MPNQNMFNIHLNPWKTCFFDILDREFFTTGTTPEDETQKITKIEEYTQQGIITLPIVYVSEEKVQYRQ